MIYLPLKLTGINPLTLFNHHPKHASTEEYRGIMIVLPTFLIKIPITKDTTYDFLYIHLRCSDKERPLRGGQKNQVT